LPHTAYGVLQRQGSEYYSVTYSAIMNISSSNHGHIYRCTIYFDKPRESDADVDAEKPAFNFTWISSQPLNLHHEIPYGPSNNGKTRVFE